MRCSSLRLFLFGMLLAGAWARPVSAQFSIDELELHVTPTGPAAITRAFAIRSAADTAQQILLELTDWDRDSAGTNLVRALGTHASSCESRVEVFPMTLQLPPRSTEFVRVTYTPRADSVETGCWAMVLARAVRPPAATGQRTSVSISTVIGVKLNVHTVDARLEGEIVSADVEEVWERQAGGDSVRVRQLAVRFTNTGRAHLVVKSTVEIRNEATQLVAEFGGPDAHLTPGSFRDILIPLPANLARGRYVAVVLLDYGGDEITAAQLDVEIP